MNIICVDDEKLMLKNIMTKLKGLPDLDVIEGFRSSLEALAYTQSHPVDVAFLDINMPEMDGIELAKHLKEYNPKINIVFTTGYEEYALEAYTVRPNGYLLKPYTKEKIKAEIDNVKSIQGLITRKGITIQTFGEFDVFVDHQPVKFHRSKSKEILAILVDHNGEFMTSGQIAAYIWPEEEYDRSKQKQMSVFLNEMCSALEEAGASEILIRNRSHISMDKRKFNCDYFSIQEGNPTAVNAYHGEYMRGYSWAQATNDRLKEKFRV